MSDIEFQDTGCGCSKDGREVDRVFPEGNTRRMVWTTRHRRGALHVSEWVLGVGTRLVQNAEVDREALIPPDRTQL